MNELIALEIIVSIAAKLTLIALAAAIVFRFISLSEKEDKPCD